MEQEPALEITMNGEKLIAHRGNTALFTFIGELAVYDHVFILTDEETNSGGYLFKNQKIWSEMTSFLLENLYPMHLNMEEVAECDRIAFENTMYPDIRTHESFPDTWLATDGED